MCCNGGQTVGSVPFRSKYKYERKKGCVQGFVPAVEKNTRGEFEKKNDDDDCDKDGGPTVWVPFSRVFGFFRYGSPFPITCVASSGGFQIKITTTTKTTIHYALIAVYSRIAAPEGLCQLNKIRFILLNLGDMVTMLLWYQLPGDAETDTPKGDLNGSFWGGKKYMGMAYKKCGFYMHAEG